MFKYYILLSPKRRGSFNGPTHSVIWAFTRSSARNRFMKKNKISNKQFICEAYTKTELISVGLRSKCNSFSKELILNEEEEISRKILSFLSTNLSTRKFYDYLETKTDSEILRLSTDTMHFGIIFIRQLYLNDFDHPLYRSLACMLGDGLENAPFSLSNLKTGNQRENLINFLVDFYSIARKHQEVWNEVSHSNLNFNIIAQAIFKPKYMAFFEIEKN
ncbi:hypothetical protein ACE1MS_23070 (plasmid) [Lysinibacillus sp. fkY74-1]